MTKKAAYFISEGLNIMEDGIFMLKGKQRKQVCELMQQLQNLTGARVDLEARREYVRLEWGGGKWPAPTPDSLAEPYREPSSITGASRSLSSSDKRGRDTESYRTHQRRAL